MIITRGYPKLIITRGYGIIQSVISTIIVFRSIITTIVFNKGYILQSYNIKSLMTLIVSYISNLLRKITIISEINKQFNHTGYITKTFKARSII
jgi:hypothetical protein